MTAETETDAVCHECENAPAERTIYIGRASQSLDELREHPVCSDCGESVVGDFTAADHLRVALMSQAGQLTEIHG